MGGRAILGGDLCVLSSSSSMKHKKNFNQNLKFDFSLSFSSKLSNVNHFTLTHHIVCSLSGSVGRQSSFQNLINIQCVNIALICSLFAHILAGHFEKISHPFYSLSIYPTSLSLLPIKSRFLFVLLVLGSRGGAGEDSICSLIN